MMICITTGCELNNTPTSKVEELISNYQMLDNNIQINHELLSNDEEISEKHQNRYEDLIEKQYKNLSYEVKEEIIDGDSATITVEIEVVDYKKIIDKYDKTKYQTDEYHEVVLKSLEKATDKITYTIDFIVNKKENGNWETAPLDRVAKEKILGIN